MRRSRGREVRVGSWKDAWLSCFLGSTTAASRSTSATRLETATGWSARVSASSRNATREAASAERLLRTLAALFDLELDTVDGVGVGGNGGLVGGRGLEVDKRAVLREELVQLKG